MSEQLTAPFREPEPLPDIPIEEMTDEEALNSAKHHHMAIARAQALYLRSIARFATKRKPNRSGIELADGAAEELAMELCITPKTAASQLCEAKELTSRLPETVKALQAGKIDYMRAKAMADYTTDLDTDDAADVEKRVLVCGKQENLTRFKYLLRREVIRADPLGAEQRRLLNKVRRNVSKWHKDDGSSSLNITLEPHEAELAYKQIDALAEMVLTPGRSIEQCRADVFMDLVMGKDFKRPPVHVNVMIPMTTLLGLNQSPGEITGVGPITARYARLLSQDATWRRVITEPTGQVLEVSRRRFASPALKDFIEIRDKVCRQPGCTTLAEDCEADHTDTYAEGGLTSVDNLAILCKKHNLMRQRSKWRLSQPEPGTLVFESPLNRKLVTTPEPYDQPPY